jgi:hypothetical protein
MELLTFGRCWCHDEPPSSTTLVPEYAALHDWTLDEKEKE